MICERNGIETENCIASWSDDSGATFRLREESSHIFESIDASCSAQDRVHFAGTSAAVWKIGGVYIKVKSHISLSEQEADTISFVQAKASAIPLPVVVHTWIDESLCRTFLLLKQIKGKTLVECWPFLSPLQRTDIAAIVARFCKLLAQTSASRLQSVSGFGVVESSLTKHPPRSRPSWMPYLLGPLYPAELSTYLLESRPATLPNIPDVFYLYHADLGPTNIMISETGSVEGILDWESAGYYPWFWIATKPLVSAGFNLPTGSEDRYAWAKLLTCALKLEGFEPALDQFEIWKNALGSRNTTKSSNDELFNIPSTPHPQKV